MVIALQLGVMLAAMSVPAQAHGFENGGATLEGPAGMAPLQVRGYPKAALLKREQGDARFTVILDKENRVSDCRVEVSSGSTSLDAATCRLVARYGRFELGPRDSNIALLEGVVRWRLPAGLPPAEKPVEAPVKTAVDASRQICRDIRETQWRTATHRICMSEERWEKIGRETRKDYGEFLYESKSRTSATPGS